MTEMDKSQMVQFIIPICPKYGCVIGPLDLDNKIIDLAGPSGTREECLRKLKPFLD